MASVAGHTLPRWRPSFCTKSSRGKYENEITANSKMLDLAFSLKSSLLNDGAMIWHQSWNSKLLCGVPTTGDTAIILASTKRDFLAWRRGNVLFPAPDSTHPLWTNWWRPNPDARVLLR